MQRVGSEQAVTGIDDLVRGVLLQDGKGQILLANDSLLDLKALNSLVERNLIPIPQSEIADLTAKNKLVQIESAPAFFLLPTIIDENIASAQYCHIEILNVDGVELEKIDLAELRQHGIGDAPPMEVPIEIYQRLDLNPIEVLEVVQKIVASDEELKQIAANFKT